MKNKTCIVYYGFCFIIETVEIEHVKGSWDVKGKFENRVGGHDLLKVIRSHYLRVREVSFSG